MSRSTYQNMRHYIRRQQRRLQIKRLLRGGSQSQDRPPPSSNMATVYGLFSSASGLGEAARCLADGLEALGCDVRRIDVTNILDPDAVDDPCLRLPQSEDEDPGSGPVFVHLNPVEATEVLVRLKPPNLAGRKRIGIWIYELPTAPPAWREYLDVFDRVWTPSESSARSLASLGLESHVVPYQHRLKVDAVESMDPPLSTEGPGRDRFEVIVFADARSSLARKNVAGAVSAFQRAFEAQEPVRLILKLSNVPTGEISSWAADRRVDLITDIVSPAERIRMIERADVLLSLHRAEGYGLSLIEAMLCGTALILSEEPTTMGLHVQDCVWPVKTQRIPVDDRQKIYSGGTWADADLDEASRQLRTLFEAWQSGTLDAGREARRSAARKRFGDSQRLVAMKDALDAIFEKT